MSFLRRIHKAWSQRYELHKNGVFSFQMRLRLAKQFQRGVSDEPPPIKPQPTNKPEKSNL